MVGEVVTQYWKTRDPIEGIDITVGTSEKEVIAWTKDHYCTDPNVSTHLGQIELLPATREEFEVQEHNAGRPILN